MFFFCFRNCQALPNCARAHRPDARALPAREKRAVDAHHCWTNFILL